MKNDVSNLKQLQLRQLAKIGDYLSQVRQEQSLSLEQIANRTNIQRRLLRAIEAGNLTGLPEPIYVQGFIKRYAEALGLNGHELADKFPTGPIIQAFRPSWKNSPAAQLRPLHLYILYLLLIMTSVSGLAYLLERPSSQTAVNSRNAAKTLTASDANQPATKPANQPTQPAADKQADDADQPDQAIRVKVTLTAQSWMRVVIDEKTEFEGVLQQGEHRTWTADQKLTLRAGNAGGVLVAFNDQAAQKLGEPGAVEEVTFPGATNTASLEVLIAAGD
ncbi:MAG: helix-turn-helix domain-containing protein [Cyanothece sp. SIO1E1]|nr:helix-turn-helix domain-containing protein [Cyanothece sp. SIO1E1]